LESGQISILYGKGILDSSLSADQTIVGLFGVEGAQIGRISSGQYQIQQTFTSPFGNGGAFGTAISPDGNLFISGNTHGVHVWEPNSGQLIALAQDRSRTGNYGTMQWTNDGRILIVAGDNGVIYLWGVKK
jgi:WD40 repeat protein